MNAKGWEMDDNRNRDPMSQFRGVQREKRAEGVWAILIDVREKSEVVHAAPCPIGRQLNSPGLGNYAAIIQTTIIV